MQYLVLPKQNFISWPGKMIKLKEWNSWLQLLVASSPKGTDCDVSHNHSSEHLPSKCGFHMVAFIHE